MTPTDARFDGSRDAALTLSNTVVRGRHVCRNWCRVEDVANAAERPDEDRMVTVAFKAPAKSFDMDVERLRRSICHDLAPDTFHQLFSLDHLASSLKQKPQDEELLLREARQWFAIAEDDPGAEVELDALGSQEVPSRPRRVTARNQLSLKVRDQLAEVRCGRHHMTSCRRGDGASPNSEPCPAAPIGENVRVRSESTMTASWCGSKRQVNFRNFAKLFATLLSGIGCSAASAATPPLLRGGRSTRR